MSGPNALHHLAATAVNGVNGVPFPFLEQLQQQVSSAPSPAVSPVPSVQVPSAQAAVPQLPSSLQAQSTPPAWQAETPQRQLDPQHAAQLSIPSANSQSRSPALPTANPSIAANSIPTTAPSSFAPSQGLHSSAPLTTQAQAYAALAATPDSSATRKRGRPRKYFDEESRRAAEYARRKRVKNANGDDTDGASDPGVSGKKEERRPYLHYQMDYGHYDSSKPDALTARDVMVQWLSTGTNFADWLEWPMEKRNEVALELREELKSHGMLDRDTVSIKQQITFIQRGCEEAKRYEKEKMNEPLTPFNATKVSYLVNRGLTPGQAYIEHTWPFYPKLKSAVADVSVPMPISRPPRQPKPDLPKAPPRFQPPRSTQIPGLNYDTTAGEYDSIDDALDPALTGGGPLTEPSASEVLAVTSWANQLLNQESQRRQTGNKLNLPGMDDAESLRILREKEKWELEKLQIRQKLELEKEQMKMKDKNAERDTHIQSILVFRDLLKDGLKRNEAGRIVWRENWDQIKASMDADDV